MSTDNTSICRCLVCQDYGDRDQIDDVDAKLISNIDQTGWGVLAIPEDDTSPGWAFTVGLWHSYRVPEIALFGLDPAIAMRCLNTVGAQVAAGRTLSAGDELDEVLGNDYLVTVRSIDEGWYATFFGAAMGFYRVTPAVPFLQLLWPDRDGRFPGDNDFAPQYELLQPQLWLSRNQHPRGPWTS
ncbi:DUF4262 domain-containing protein [Amycolatopsis taiwanensis]|uniref:DUF4262 domain-containing protein n=1 Tax=Amycolatopsis taiwanensis TaxID=342230 RepID=UPI0005C2327C|nr:DUF4262 domain-containing protein [Amycolatopsis taiwanensis]